MSDTAQPTVTGIGDEVESKGTDENHTPILPAENHTPLLPAENHTPLLPAENHTPVAPESAESVTAAGQRIPSQKKDEPNELLGDEDVSTLENHTPVAPARGEA